MRPALPLVLVVTATLTAACGGPSCDDLDGTTPSVTVGTGESSFDPLSEGDHLTPAWGPQGGQHLWASVRTTGLHPGSLGSRSAVSPSTIAISVHDDEGAVASYGPVERSLQRRLGDGFQGEATGLTAVVHAAWDLGYPLDFLLPDGTSYEDATAADWEAASAEARARTWSFEATVTDACGNEASDAVAVRLDDLWLDY